MRRSRPHRFRPVLGAVVFILGLHLSPGTNANNEPGATDDKRGGNDHSIGHLDYSPYETAADFFAAFLQTGNFVEAAYQAGEDARERVDDFNRSARDFRLRQIRERENAAPITAVQETHIRTNLKGTAYESDGLTLDLPTVPLEIQLESTNYAPAAIEHEEELIRIFRVQRTF